MTEEHKNYATGGGSGYAVGAGGGGGNIGLGLRTTVTTTPDAIDRINELLRSAIDYQNRITHRISIVIDKLVGPRPAEVAGPTGGDIMSIATLLSELERAQSATNNEIDRLREAKL